MLANSVLDTAARAAGDCVQLLLPEGTRRFGQQWLPVDAAALALGVLVEAPLCVWGSFKSLSSIAAVGVVSTGVVTALVVVLPLLDPHKECLVEATPHRVVGGAGDVLSAAGIMAVRPSTIPVGLLYRTSNKYSENQRIRIGKGSLLCQPVADSP